MSYLILLPFVLVAIIGAVLLAPLAIGSMLLLGPLIFGCLLAVVVILRGYVAWSFANDPHTKLDDDAFEDWYYDECHIAAAEEVGPNSIEYDHLVEKMLEDDARKAAARKFYNGMDRHETADR